MNQPDALFPGVDTHEPDMTRRDLVRVPGTQALLWLDVGRLEDPGPGPFERGE